jgi:hypothetical protein
MRIHNFIPLMQLTMLRPMPDFVFRVFSDPISYKVP